MLPRRQVTEPGRSGSVLLCRLQGGEAGVVGGGLLWFQADLLVLRTLTLCPGPGGEQRESLAGAQSET